MKNNAMATLDCPGGKHAPQYVIAMGDPHKRVTLHGPFESRDEALNWVKANNPEGCECHLAELNVRVIPRRGRRLLAELNVRVIPRRRRRRRPATTTEK